MQDNDRGTYTPPTEDNLAYETRRSSGGGGDQTPITLIVSAIFLVLLLIAVILFWNSGYNNRSRLAKEVGQPLGDYRVTVQEAKPLTPDELSEGAPVADSASVNAPIIDEAPPAAVPITTGIPAQSEATSSAQPQPVAPVTQTPAPAAPAQKPVVAATPAPATTPAASGSGVVQIGAFASRDIAERQYSAITSNYAMFLGGTSRRIEEVQVDGKTFYRTSVVGFASKDRAREFCNALKSSGRDCFVR